MDFNWLSDFAKGGGIGQTQTAMQGGMPGIEAYEAMPWYSNMNNWSQILGKAAGIVAPGDWQEKVGNMAAGIGQSNNMQVANKKSELERASDRQLINQLLRGVMTGRYSPTAADQPGLTSMTRDDKGITVKYTPEASGLSESNPLGLDMTGAKPEAKSGAQAMNFDFLGAGEGTNVPFQGGSTGSPGSMYQLGLSPEMILEHAKLKGTIDDATIKNVLAAGEMAQNQPLKDAMVRMYGSHAKAYEAQASPEQIALATQIKQQQLRKAVADGTKSEAEALKELTLFEANVKSGLMKPDEIQSLIDSRKASTTGTQLDNRLKNYNWMAGVPRIEVEQKDATLRKTEADIVDIKRQADAGDQDAKLRLDSHLNDLEMALHATGNKELALPQKLTAADSYNRLSNKDVIYLAQDVGGSFEIIPKRLGRLSTGRQVEPWMIYDAVQKGMPLNVALSRAGVMGNFTLPGR